MDNLLAGINGVTVRQKTLRAALANAGIEPTVRYDKKSDVKLILFSIPVGPHQARWLIKVYPQRRYLTVSGGVTKTFFGLNVWVFNDEYAQLKAIISILATELSRLDGIEFPPSLAVGSFESVVVERVELTAHFPLPPRGSQAAAIERLYKMFMLLFPKRHYRSGENEDNPGTIGIGRTKSNRECRVYDPNQKIKPRPAHVSEAAWKALFKAVARHLRVEVIAKKAEICKGELDKVEAWRDRAKIGALVAKKYLRFGLTFRAETTNTALTPAEVQAHHPSLVARARAWFRGETAAAPSNPRSGSLPRFRKFMAEHGYNIKVPFAKHEILAHGLHEVLKPANRAELPDELRNDATLFARWWEKKNWR